MIHGFYLRQRRIESVVPASTFSIAYDSKVYLINTWQRNIGIMSLVFNLRWLNPLMAKPILIEDEFWLAAGAFVHTGVSIEGESVVSAGSIVTRGACPLTIVAVSPARIINACFSQVSERNAYDKLILGNC